MIRRQMRLSMSARTARQLSIAVMIALVASYGVTMLAPDLPRWAELMSGAAKITALFGAILLFLRDHGDKQQADDSLRKERERARAQTHQIMIGVLLLAIIYLQIVPRLGGWTPEFPDFVEGLTVYTLLSMALPTIILAFRR